ncbi:MAG: putative ABC transport system permease protein [Planctomycetota bacterium]|jgi:putative ABC transport system permease protein
MNLLRLIQRNLSQRKLSSCLTILSVALGTMMVCAILVARREVDEKYLRQAEGFELVVGPTGSGLELVLNSIYHVEQSPGLLPYSVLGQLQKQKRYVRAAVPYALGDSFRGHRVVATNEDLFSKWFPVPAGEGSEKLSQGRPFHCFDYAMEEALEDLRNGTVAEAHEQGHDHAADRQHPNEAVLGSEVARKHGLGVGDKIEPSHNVEGAKAHSHDDAWEVVGIFKETGTPIDRVVFINLDSFYRIPDHAGGLLPTTGEPGLSSILLFPRGAHAKITLMSTLRNRSDLQVAEVATQISKLLSIVGGVREFFLVMAWLVVITGVIGITVAIYNTMNDRRREIAIMRALGARQRTVMGVIVGEAFALGLFGSLAGLVLGHVLLAAAKSRIVDVSGIHLDATRVLSEEILALAVVAVAAAVAGLVPAWKAYRTDVASNLNPIS